ncbi:porin family protein [Sulfuriroseicoccus oceanibius]|uniref:Uncharacterized protein n=1 Tax=Sulfuriroseicoccus oceanibius TaxID=2707525 RepID=A0A6B3L974_9BACT|nr:porin family protein [Sulfuriroseicoccus oceanibius]QQL45093.1 hypothetical protein G3M56_000455 [Sulfuriroseicoccus oceanibius]
MKTTTLTLAAALICCGFATAGTTPVEPKAPIIEEPASDWHFGISPYLWTTAVTGTMGVGGVTGDVDMSIRDVLDQLDFAAAGVVSLGKGKWSISTDLFYAKLSDGFDLGGLIFKNGRIDYKQILVTPRIGYTAVATENYMMDVMLGARYTRNELGITARFVRGGQVERSGTEDFWDPTIGVRGKWNFNGPWYTRYNAEIGGFGVSSDFLWNAMLGIGYEINDTAAVIAGYRGLGVDYSDGSYTNDTIMHGPIVGFEFTW